MQAEEVQAQLERCRRLARDILDSQTKAALEALARELEQQLSLTDDQAPERARRALS